MKAKFLYDDTTAATNEAHLLSYNSAIWLSEEEISL